MGEKRDWIEARGWRPIIVHMGPADAGIPPLDGFETLADPDRKLYRSFGLSRATPWQLLRPEVWKQGLRALAAGHRGGALAGDGLQMPGVFLVHQGKVIRAHRASHAADHWTAAAFAELRPT